MGTIGRPRYTDFRGKMIHVITAVQCTCSIHVISPDSGGRSRYFATSPALLIRSQDIPILRNSQFFSPKWPNRNKLCVKRVHNRLSQTSNGKLSVTPLTIPINYIINVNFSLVVFTTSLLRVKQDQRVSQAYKQHAVIQQLGKLSCRLWNDNSCIVHICIRPHGFPRFRFAFLFSFSFFSELLSYNSCVMYQL